MAKVKTFTFSPFSENTYVVSDPKGNCVIIDPGCYDRNEQQELMDYLKSGNLKPAFILNTHCHIDHIFGNAFLKRTLNVPLLAPEKDLYNLQGAELYARATGLHFDPSPQPDAFFVEGQNISFGGVSFEVLFVPGHSAGHVAFHHRESKKLFSGDVLFQGSIGRTDLPGGNYEVLMQSIFTKVLPLGDEVEVYSGHGGLTTIGAEKRSNPFILQHRV
jgi:glyoxylase-like metal-dependent hydrolase (beta-lactamase superfamily II)